MRRMEVHWQLEGLVQQPELNGAHGVLQECWCGTWTVKCGELTVRVQTQNARVPSASRVQCTRDKHFERGMQAGSPAMMEEHGQRRVGAC